MSPKQNPSQPHTHIRQWSHRSTKSVCFLITRAMYMCEVKENKNPSYVDTARCRFGTLVLLHYIQSKKMMPNNCNDMLDMTWNDMTWNDPSPSPSHPSIWMIARLLELLLPATEDNILWHIACGIKCLCIGASNTDTPITTIHWSTYFQPCVLSYDCCTNILHFL